MSRSHDVTISGFDLDRLEAELAKALRERDEARLAITRLEADLATQTSALLEARACLAELRSLPASAGDASPSRDARGYLHEAGVVGALRERLDRVTGLLRDVERETRQPSERFDEVWAEVREVLRG